MSLDDHVNLSIVADSVSASRQGFGVIGVLSHNCDDWGSEEGSRSYANASEVAADWETDTPEYLACAKIFSQSPRVPLVKILNAQLNKPTQKYTASVATVKSSYTYQLLVSGVGFDEETVEYESDSASTEAEIVSGMVDALNAVDDKNFTAALAALVIADDTFTAAASDICTNVAHGRQTGDGPVQLTTSAADLPLNLLTATDYWFIRLTDDTFSFASSLANALAGIAVDIDDAGTGTHTYSDTGSTKDPSNSFTITGNAAGDWFSVKVINTVDFAIAQTHSDADVDEDLAAIALLDTDWFYLMTLYNSEDYILTVGAWAQANEKQYYAASSATADLGTSTGTAGVGDKIRALAYKRVSVDYHPTPALFADGAVLGTIAARKIGSWTAKFKRRTGVTVVPLTTSQRANLVARQMNFYESTKGLSLTSEGTTAGDGVYKFIDNVVNIDWLKDTIATNVFSMLNSLAKVPYDDSGAALVEAQVQAGLSEGLGNGVLTNDTPPTVSVPKMADVSSSNRALRILPDVAFTCTLAGAIHKVQVTGTVSP